MKEEKFTHALYYMYFTKLLQSLASSVFNVQDRESKFDRIE